MDSSDIADKTQERTNDQASLKERQQEMEKLKKDLADETARCAKEKAAFEAEDADLSHAIQGLKDAIQAMKSSKPSLLQLKTTLGETFELAEAMNIMKTPKRKAVAAFIQGTASVDPDNAEFEFHSDGIIEVCEDLLKDYTDNRDDLRSEWSKTDKGCKEMKASLNDKIVANDDAQKTLNESIDRLRKEIASHREDLINAQSVLKDDEQYLKDLTGRCEARAHDYDQRSQMRGSEIGALDSALEVLTGTVKGKADAVNVRAFIQKAAVPSTKAAVAAPVASKVLKDISFLQEVASNIQTRAFLGMTQKSRMEKALNVLRKTGSPVLLSLAERASADPFKKVKGLIQKLIERLLTEAKNEATKKGFCDTELGKARKDRDFRWEKANALSAELASLEAKQDSLEAELEDLTRDIKDETEALKVATEDRKDEKDENVANLETARDGLDGVKQALQVLRSFYKQAAKAAAFVQASPVDQDTAGAGFKGNYKGNQSGSQAVLALLETIQSDFERTIKTTDEQEHAAHREFVDFSQTSKSSIAGKETKKKLDEQDLKTTKASINTKMEDLQSNMNLLDNALQELEELKPTCIDTGMSYAERVEKREEEMAALQKALCILDEEGVEPLCGP